MATSERAGADAMRRRMLKFAAFATAALLAATIAAWAGGAVYLVWAGLDVRASSPTTLARYAAAYGARPGEGLRIALSVAAPLAAGVIASLGFVTAPARHAHGRARWGSVFDLGRAGLLADRGLLLGVSGGAVGRAFVRDGGEGHVFVVAPTGAGKTSGIVIPNLLSWTGSVVTLDPKREAWAATAGWRAAHGQAFLWAPLDGEGRTCRFNPLDQITAADASGAASPRRAIDLMKLAAALIPEPLNDTRWIAQGAQRLFRALALYVLDTPAHASTIGEIWRIATTPDDLQAWCHFQAITRRDLDPACVADLAAFAGAVDKERAYILNELHNALQPWSSSLVRAATSASDFTLADLGRRRMAIYLALDPGDMAAYGKLLRVFVELAADALMRVDRAAPRRHEVLLLIDEFATFGRLPMIETLMAAARGYGVRILAACQALSQLDDVYGLAGRNALLGNATRQVFMASPDPATSGYVSRRIGDATIETRSRSRQAGASGRTSVSTGFAARTFLKPEEFERMGRGRALLLAPGAPPFRIRVEAWFARATFRRRWSEPPAVAALDLGLVPRPFRAVAAGRRSSAGPTGGDPAHSHAQTDMFAHAAAAAQSAANAPAAAAGPGVDGAVKTASTIQPAAPDEVAAALNEDIDALGGDDHSA